jgi:hypothetical protein
MTEPVTRPRLLARIRDLSDGQAWGQFVESYAPVVLGYALRHGLQEADADDLAQEVFRAVARFPVSPRPACRRQLGCRLGQCAFSYHAGQRIAALGRAFKDHLLVDKHRSRFRPSAANQLQWACDALAEDGRIRLFGVSCSQGTFRSDGEKAITSGAIRSVAHSRR